MPDTDRQIDGFTEAKVVNELARRLIAEHSIEWRPHREMPSAMLPIARALDGVAITRA
jgi:hypothetical protein